MGYAGGSKADPTYRSMGDHMESIQIDYDPSRITYDQLLQHFWDWHNAFGKSWSRQYASAVMYGDQEQKKQALASQAALEAQQKNKTSTEIIELDTFYPAEDYHQKYRLRGSMGYLAAFGRIYQSNTDQAILESTVAARLNGYLAGEGSLTVLAKELPLMGLSLKEQRRLWDAVSMRRPNAKVTCPLPQQ